VSVKTARHRARQNWIDWGFVAFLLVLCALLTALQYRWTGEVSRAETARLRAALAGQAQSLANALNNPARAGSVTGMMLELKLNLSDSLADEARARGLLEPPAIERMLRDELRRSRVEQLFTATGRWAAQELPALSEAEVEQEIQAARARRRGLGAKGVAT
jgi:hypothetical protein